jgi:hypothetical protein
MKYWNMPVAQAVSEVMKLSAVQAVSRQICVPLYMLVALPVMAGDEWTLERSDGDISVFSKRTEGSSSGGNARCRLRWRPSGH